MFKFTHLLLTGILLLAVAIASGQPAKAQKPAPSPTPAAEPSQEGKVTVTTRRVRLPITVVDKKGQFVGGLSQGDFQVLEDKIPQQIDSFTSEQNNNLPLYVRMQM